MGKKTFTIAGILSINVLILSLLLFGVEGYFWFMDPKRHLPINGYINEKYYTWGHPVINNRYQFREKDFAVPKPPGVYRIMVLGDSLTWGAGLAVEERYTNLLERYLREAFPDREFEVLNFGVPGGPTTKERDMLRQFKDVVRPDLIVVGFCLNDPQPRDQDYSIEKHQFEMKYGKRIDSGVTILGSLGLPRLGKEMKKAVYNYIERAGIAPPWDVALQRTYEQSSEEWKDFEQALRDIKAMSDQMNLPAPIFATLNQRALASEYRKHPEYLKTYLRWYSQAEQAAAEGGLRVHNHEQEIAAKFTNDDSPVVNVVDGHPSAELNQIYAHKLFEVIAADLTGRGYGRSQTNGRPQH